MGYSCSPVQPHSNPDPCTSSHPHPGFATPIPRCDDNHPYLPSFPSPPLPFSLFMKTPSWTIRKKRITSEHSSMQPTGFLLITLKTLDGPNLCTFDGEKGRRRSRAARVRCWWFGYRCAKLYRRHTEEIKVLLFFFFFFFFFLGFLINTTTTTTPQHPHGSRKRKDSEKRRRRRKG